MEIKFETINGQLCRMVEPETKRCGGCGSILYDGECKSGMCENDKPQTEPCEICGGIGMISCEACNATGRVPIEPEPKPAYAVGDWVECRSTLDGRLIQDQIVDVDADGFVTRDLEEFGCFTFDGQFHYDTLPPCQCEYYTITRKLQPSEVVVDIGCLSWTVLTPNSVVFYIKDRNDDMACIPFAMPAEPTAKLVKDLLEKQEGEINGKYTTYLSTMRKIYS